MILETEKKNERLESDLKKMEKNIEMPNLVGKSLSEAVGIISNLGLQYELDGEGGKVKAQYPAPTTLVYKNGIVVISTQKKPGNLPGYFY